MLPLSRNEILEKNAGKIIVLAPIHQWQPRDVWRQVDGQQQNSLVLTLDRKPPTQRGEAELEGEGGRGSTYF